MARKVPHLYLMTMKAELAAAFSETFDNVGETEIIRDDFVSFMDKHPFVDGIVSPANSFGLLTGGFDKALRDYFGKPLQEAVQHKILTEWFGEQTVGTSMVVEIPDGQEKSCFILLP